MFEWDDSIALELERLFSDWDAATCTFKRDGAMGALERSDTAFTFDWDWFDRMTSGESEAKPGAQTIE